jgi:predicted cupin superfamily sugar epimerase
MKFSPSYWKERLGLAKHVEGGSFKEIYRSPLILPADAVLGHGGERAASTAIYFLLEAREFSAFHRIASDELWHFYDGDVLFIYEIDKFGVLSKHLLGKSLDGSVALQVLIPAGSWFASRVEAPGSYALCGCTVAPGFDFADFELAGRHELQKTFPAHSQIIEELTYPKN